MGQSLNHQVAGFIHRSMQMQLRKNQDSPSKFLCPCVSGNRIPCDYEATALGALS